MFKSYGLMAAIWAGVVKYLPNKLVYAAFIRVWTYSVSGEYSNEMPSRVTALTAARRWSRDKLGRVVSDG